MIQPISAQETHQLRQQILRPQQSIQDCIYPLDLEPDSYHIGYFQQEQLVGIGSIYREALPSSSDSHTWRLRGMAVTPSAQGKGIGGQILTALIQYAASHSCPGTIWCNGRLPAVPFYQRYGFTTMGEEFDLPGIGAHLVLVRSLTQQDLEPST